MQEKEQNVKKVAVKRRKYENKERIREDVTGFDYQPIKCKKPYRIIAIRRKIEVTKGQLRLEDEVRYFFYITNNRDMSAEEVVRFSCGRCNHENKIEQLKLRFASG